MKTMDDQWFKAVNEGLKKIELERANRLALLLNEKGVINKMIYCHPAIMCSQYWHPSDANATADWFDWQVDRYPLGYLRYVRGESRGTVHRFAEQPYNPSSSGIDNQKKLISRIVMLGLESLLPPG